MFNITVDNVQIFYWCLNVIQSQNLWGAAKSGVPQGLWSEPFFFMVYLKSTLFLFSNEFFIRC